MTENNQKGIEAVAFAEWKDKFYQWKEEYRRKRHKEPMAELVRDWIETNVIKPILKETGGREPVGSAGEPVCANNALTEIVEIAWLGWKQCVKSNTRYDETDEQLEEKFDWELEKRHFMRDGWKMAISKSDFTQAVCKKYLQTVGSAGVWVEIRGKVQEACNKSDSVMGVYAAGRYSAFKQMLKWLDESVVAPSFTSTNLDDRAEEIARRHGVYYYESGEVNESVLSALEEALRRRPEAGINSSPSWEAWLINYCDGEKPDDFSWTDVVSVLEYASKSTQASISGEGLSEKDRIWALEAAIKHLLGKEKTLKEELGKFTQSSINGEEGKSCCQAKLDGLQFTQEDNPGDLFTIKKEGEKYFVVWQNGKEQYDEPTIRDALKRQIWIPKGQKEAIEALKASYYITDESELKDHHASVRDGYYIAKEAILNPDRTVYVPVSVDELRAADKSQLLSVGWVDGWLKPMKLSELLKGEQINDGASAGTTREVPCDAPFRDNNSNHQ